MTNLMCGKSQDQLGDNQSSKLPPRTFGPARSAGFSPLHGPENKRPAELRTTVSVRAATRRKRRAPSPTNWEYTGSGARESIIAGLPSAVAIALLAIACLLSSAWSGVTEEIEEKQTLQKTFPLDDASGARQVEVDNFEGSIRVTGSTGREVQLLVNETIEADSKEKVEAARRDVRLDITQSNQTVRCFVDGPFRCKNGSINFRGWEHYGYKVRYDFELQVPQKTALRLK